MVLRQRVAFGVRSIRVRDAAAEIDVVRIHLFGSYAANYDLRDDEAVQRWLDFFDRLKSCSPYQRAKLRG